MRRGFTLLEILVALSLLFVVLTTVYQSFRIHIRGMERGRAVQRETFTARLILDMMAKDLQSAYWEEGTQAVEGQKEVETSESEVPRFFVVQSMSEADRSTDRIAFLSMGPSWRPRQTKSPLVHEVEYRLMMDDETERWVLVRREDITPDSDLLSGGVQWILAEDVQGFEVECMDAKGETPDAWDSREKGALPSSVLLRLWPSRAEQNESETVPYTLRVGIPIAGKEGEGT